MRFSFFPVLTGLAALAVVNAFPGERSSPTSRNGTEGMDKDAT